MTRVTRHGKLRSAGGLRHPVLRRHARGQCRDRQRIDVLRADDVVEVRLLRPGDWLDIAPHRRHRVDWTDPATPTVWLAVFYR